MTLLAVAAVLAALGALAGCGAVADPTATTTTSSATAATTSGPPTPTLPRDVEPVLVARAHHAATDLPELGNLPYALGRVLHNAGMAVSLPRGSEHLELVPVGRGLLVSALVQPGDHCHSYYLAPDGRLLELRGTCYATAVNAAGTSVTGRYLGAGESTERYAVYALPSGRLTALSPVLPGDAGYRDTVFDGEDVIVDPESGALRVRWNPVTGTVSQEPRPRHTVSPQLERLIDEEWSSVPSPDGTLSVLVSSGGQLVGVWRTANEQFVVGKRDVPGFITESVWQDDDRILLIVASPAGTDTRLATLRVSTGRITWSARVHGVLLVAASRPDPA